MKEQQKKRETGKGNETKRAQKETETGILGFGRG
jgi:hypothetical protein